MSVHAWMLRWGLAGFGWLGLTASAWAQQTTVVEYIHTDALGSPVAVTDSSGNVIERQIYEPYGAQLTTAPSDTPGFTGHVSDSLTGLNYMQQRYYDPTIGRFLSVDPVTAMSDPVSFFNRYKYAANNPYKFTDPDGRCEKVTGSNICGGGGVAKAMLATSVRSPLDIGANKQSGSAQPTARASSAGNPAPASAPARFGGKGEVTSAFTGDTKTTFTYAAAYGVGVKAELKEGPNNDRYSIATPALGVTAAGTWNVVTASYDFLPSQNPTPVDAGINLGGEIGLIGVIGGGFRYTPPAKFEVIINAGFGAAARIEVFEIGLTPGKLP